MTGRSRRTGPAAPSSTWPSPKPESRGRRLCHEVESMILFDLIGDCDLQVPREANSDEAIYEVFAAAASELSGSGSPAPFVGETSAISDDHIPFIEKGIPTIDIIDFTFGSGETPGPYWHTTEDTLDKVCPESLEAVGEPAVRVLDPSG